MLYEMRRQRCSGEKKNEVMTKLSNDEEFELFFKLQHYFSLIHFGNFFLFFQSVKPSIDLEEV